jgi:membrane protease YdiL (CAAX protease family)
VIQPVRSIGRIEHAEQPLAEALAPEVASAIDLPSPSDARPASGTRFPVWLRENTVGHPGRVALGYLAALSAAELVTALVEPHAGLWLHALVLLALSLHSALTWGHPIAHLLLSLTIAPLIRLLSLSMPMPIAPDPIVAWYLLVSVPLFAVAWAVMRALGLVPADVGLNLRRPLVQLAVASTGLALGYVEHRILAPTPLIQALTWRTVWLPGLTLLFSTGFCEELIFRGVMQRTASDTLGRWGLVYVAALFAVLHVGYRSALDVAFVFAVALFFGWIAIRSRSIVGISLAHGLTNIVLFLVAPFLPIPGM